MQFQASSGFLTMATTTASLVLPTVLFTVRLRQSSEKVYLRVLGQERSTAPPLPMNTHWIASLVTFGIGSFITVKAMVTESPMFVGLLTIPSEGATSGGTGTKENYA